MISPKEYNTLPINERASMLWAEGKYLETWYDYGKFKIMLYVIQETFIEVYYKVDSDNIHEIIAWNKMPMIGRVLEGVF